MISHFIITMLITAKPRNVFIFSEFSLISDFNFDSFWIECNSNNKKPLHKMPLKKIGTQRAHESTAMVFCQQAQTGRCPWMDMISCALFKTQPLRFHCVSREGWIYSVVECNFFAYGHLTAIQKLLCDFIWTSLACRCFRHLTLFSPPFFSGTSCERFFFALWHSIQKESKLKSLKLNS